LPAEDNGETSRNIAQGKPIYIRSKGRGVPNSIGVYDATAKQGTYKMLEMVPMLAGLIQNTTGVNEALKGESTGPDQLVGVTELLIQKGSLMQEAFYNAIARVFVQMFQHTATVGLRMYIDNDRELVIAVGDKGSEVLRLAKGIKNEDFRVFVERENADSLLQSQANQMLNLFLEIGLIDESVFANLFNRSTPTEVTRALREMVGIRAEAARRAAKEAQAAAQQQAGAEQQAVQGQQAIQQQQLQLAREQDQDTKQHDLDKIQMKGLMDLENTNAKGAQSGGAAAIS